VQYENDPIIFNTLHAAAPSYPSIKLVRPCNASSPLAPQPLQIKVYGLCDCLINFNFCIASLTINSTHVQGLPHSRYDIDAHAFPMKNFAVVIAQLCEDDRLHHCTTSTFNQNSFNYTSPAPFAFYAGYFLHDYLLVDAVTVLSVRINFNAHH
jgi:hypothetical protein